MLHLLKIIVFWSPAITAAFYLLRWVARWAFAIWQTTKDVAAIKTNHLPHIYRLLRKVCHKLDIDPDEGEDG